MLKKAAVVVHSGGMDSSICLALAIREFGEKNVLSLSFNFGQRHANELIQAAKICNDWNVDHTELEITCLKEITRDALTDHSLPISHEKGKEPNTLVVGRNGLMARLSAIHAHTLGAHCIYMGVIEVEAGNAGYRDCFREYIDLKQKILRIDLADPSFEIRTPVIKMTKAETLHLAESMGILDYLLENTITCYEGIPMEGCKVCPACILRNNGIQEMEAERIKTT